MKVFIVDDSALVRQTLVEILSHGGQFEVMTAPNAIIAEKKIQKFQPDVMILDVEMPEMDGITYLKKIMAENPIPVVICSGQTPAGSHQALEALHAGAVEIIEKPNIGTKQFLEESRTRIIDALNAAVAVKVKKKTPAPSIVVQPKLSADAVLPLSGSRFEGTTGKIIVIGASTGGTEALQYILERLPVNIPPVCIVQHMPENFTKAFAERLDKICPPKVSEGVNGDELRQGHALVAPGNFHMLLNRRGPKYFIDVRDGALVSRHRPSVDVLFRSAAKFAGKNVIGVILTGMGDDGSTGMLEMKQSGAVTIAQDEKSCVVYGMPKEAVKKGGVDFVLPLEKIPAKIIELSMG
jgi:two-component system chemotaxis response regulator CheB